jgi:hypothetical protein
MHLYSILRGRQKLVEQFKGNFEDIFLKSKPNEFVQLVPRKVELIEWVFPSEHLGAVLKTFHNSPNGYYPDNNIASMGLRKLLKLKRIPKLDLSKYEALTCRGGENPCTKWVANHLIGIKEDRKDKNNNDVL